MFFIYFFAVVGFLSLIEKMMAKIRIKGNCGELIYILKLQGKTENIEYIIRRITNKMKWLQGSENKSIICIDKGIDSETLEIIRKLQKDNSMIKIVKSRR